MNVTITLDAASVRQFARNLDLAAKEIERGMAKAINRTAFEILEAERNPARAAFPDRVESPTSRTKGHRRTRAQRQSGPSPPSLTNSGRSLVPYRTLRSRKPRESAGNVGEP